MKKIIIDTWPIPNYQELRNIWHKNPTVLLDIHELSDYKDIVSFLIKDKDEFSFAILADLVEKVNFPKELLETVYYKGDLGCKMSVCYTKDLPSSLKEVCSELISTQHET